MHFIQLRPAALLLATLLACVSGCVKFKQVLTVHPDGSGKMHLSIAINEAMLAVAGDEDPFEDVSIPKLIAQEASGWSAFTQPQMNSVDGFKTVTFTGYFRDINAVTFGGSALTGDPTSPTDPSPPPSTTFKMENNRLTVTGGIVAQMISQLGADPSLNDPATRAMMAPIIQGLEISETYVLPGDVQTAPGYATDGPTATLTVTSDDLLGTQPFTVAALEDGTAEIAFTPAGWDDEDAWRNEFAAAQAAWAKLKARPVAEPVGAE